MKPRCRPMSAMHPVATKMLQRRDWCYVPPGDIRIPAKATVILSADLCNLDSESLCSEWLVDETTNARMVCLDYFLNRGFGSHHNKA
jgi:hypothetical protein